ncbi:iron ABC transporter permease [Haloechinothrix sp. YIM 98757]|uniref:Iron ABC transporter permease n=1 Tax=Haloechinothrix aidingensis TaxID=2752311 RepID=A0A837ZZX0_9PSEU|nr:iron ABC transporter permease [Haloechinothrix aidingensis]
MSVRAPVTAPARLRRGSRHGWFVAVVSVAVLAVIPVALVAASALTPTPEVWAQLWAGPLPGMLGSTLALMAAVAAGTLVLGAGMAWLVSVYRFPGSATFGWLLVLPLAMPAYVLGFIFLALLDAPGPVQSGLRALLGPEVWFPDVRSIPGAAVVLSLSLYPYVYLLARSAIREQAPATFEAARTLGAGRVRAGVRVALPLARPSLAAGLALVSMETLTDFATVSYFNVQTVSVGIYQVWKGQFDREAATELASLVLVFALLVIAGERLLRGRARYHQKGGAGHGLRPVPLSGVRAVAATGTCAAVLTAAFGLPVAQLLWWFGADVLSGTAGLADPRYVGYLLNSVTVAAIVAVSCVAIALVVTHGTRTAGGRLTAAAAQLTTVGYAIPGVVVAIGVLLTFAYLDTGLEALGVPGGTGLVATGSVVGIIYAYIVRFLALGYHTVDASFAKVNPAMTASALCLGAAPMRVMRRVHLPLVRTGMATAAVLVAIDALKELPIVLLLRPFGFDTLSVWTYELASESRWESAALPALTIVAVAAIPVLLLVGRRPQSLEGAR